VPPANQLQQHPKAKMDFQPKTYYIDKLVSLINSGRLALPDFQRAFVWTPSKVAELIDSVSRGWPIGSLLLLQGPQPFEPKPIAHAPALRGEVEVFVLDGQQRVTALFHAAADVSDVVYYIDFDALETGDDYVKWEKRSSFETASPTIAAQAARHVAKVAVVSDGPMFHKWQTYLPHDVGTRMVVLRDRELPGLQAKVYKCIGVALEQEIALEALARIFETINRTGVRLNAFDLMVAVLYPHQFNLREEWENARVEHAVLEQFDVDGIEVLKLIALWERRSQQMSGKRLSVKGVRQGDVLAVAPATVRDLWPHAVQAYANALDHGRTELGLVDAKSVPSSAMLLTLGFMLEAKIETHRVDNWYWWSIAAQTYAQGANTRVIRDVDRAVTGNWTEFNWTPGAVNALKVTLMEPVRRNRLLTRGVGSLLASRGALDPVTRRPLADSRSLQFADRAGLLRQGNSPETDSVIADQLFLDSTSYKRAIVDFRKGRQPTAVLDGSAMTDQGYSPSEWHRESDTAALEARAANLAEWLQEAAASASRGER
jgi:hypothetical protein